MDFFTSMKISASGLAVQRARMNVAASNLANVSTTRTEDGGPYQRKDLVVRSVAATPSAGPGSTFANAMSGVEIAEIREDGAPPRLEFDPGHPDADLNGYVAYPNVNLLEEMVDMITASRAYEAGITALNGAVSMAERATGIGR